MNQQLTDLLANRYIYAAALLFLGLVAGLAARLVVVRVLHMLTRRTESDVDDQLVHVLHRPMMWTFVVLGLSWAIGVLELDQRISYWILGALKTILVIMWSVAASQIGTILLNLLSRQVDRIEGGGNQ